ncbi:MAG: hypothetical protein ACRDOU_11295 [Streptosporangiaceae bacterium]
MRRNYSDIAIAEAIAILGCVAFFAHLPEPVMIVLGLCLFAAPGYVWSEVFLSPRNQGLERVAVAAGLALMVPVFGGMGLYAAGIPLNRTAWVGVLSVATLAGAAAALITRRRRREDPPPPRPTRSRRWSAWHAVAFGAAAVIATAAVGLAVVSADAQKYSGYTQLWLAPLPGQTSRASLGVQNEQGVATRYRLVLRRNGRVGATWTITLANGQAWQHTVSYTTSLAMAASLYRLPDLRNPYRQVDNGVAVPRKPAATPRPHPSETHS